MKISLIILALFHSVLFADQDPVPPKYNIQQKILCAGDTMDLGNKAIKFNKIVSDSRCPNGVTCIWAGEVKVLIEFYEDGEFKGDKVITGSNISLGQNEVVSGTDISIAEFFNVKGLKIKGVVVSPYPQANEKITADEYSVNLEISERVETD
ncbi:hypothetical protein [Christiangramia echinicola]|uniref:hypothetical protein n=1 Tax=Christiangramia echinicola TaxID=279359 RepID=UPI000402FFC3|nr:hypothetical protein [Christiangramia echinicola]